jgi:hypothetical protein
MSALSRGAKLIRDAAAYDKVRVNSAEYLKFELGNWESKFRYVINCIKITIRALDFAAFFELRKEALFLRSIRDVFALIDEDPVFRREKSPQINDHTAAADKATSLTFQAIAQAAHYHLAEKAIPNLPYTAQRNIFNQTVASLVNEANETLKQIISEIEDCKTKHPHKTYASAAV